MEHNIIVKDCICWDCPLFDCQSTIVDVDEDMNITELNKVGGCKFYTDYDYSSAKCLVRDRKALWKLAEAVSQTISMLVDALQTIVGAAVDNIAEDIRHEQATEEKRLLISQQRKGVGYNIRTYKRAGNRKSQARRTQHRG